uniref:Histidine triad (HIT) protein, Hit-like protein involved in cell-cycle regulation n=1 Tax=uncultured Microgenomates bacterium Rifle_16ft_4_minimus_954 TaxID=1665122 RepID=A0A0H4TAJ2_9BACT|nr:histidine triad (HIT) protein, Hit-like protein involved in cell-cycle regulation [uncultured Microgenomates bacterium Rifle_16ft_4_minimus_954]
MSNTGCGVVGSALGWGPRGRRFEPGHPDLYFMFNHAPKNYRCPLCAIRDGIEGDFPYSKQADIFFKDEFITAIIASHWWPTNKGHVLIFPNEHVENIYDISDELLSRVHSFAKKVAIAMKELYRCGGITVRQNNEQPGDQDVWHFHLHVFPRYTGDSIDQTSGLRQLSEPEKRVPYSEKLKRYFS